MPHLVRRSPVTDLLDWLDSETSRLPRHNSVHYIRVEDFTDDGSYVVRAELPGVDPDKDIEISVEGDLLTIQGRRHEEEKHKHRSEFRYGSLSRSLRMPSGAQADMVKATYGDGVLEVRVPMPGGRQEATKVPVKRVNGTPST
jgi:HSP20 family molecular chaperone IbpA